MIRAQGRGHSVCIILCGILELLAMIGSYAAHYFTKKRMGMLRHVIYLNGKWERMVSIPTIKWIMLCVIFTLIILVYLRNGKRKLNSRANIIAIIWTIAVNGWTGYFLLTYSTVRNPAYYILSICFIFIMVLQNILYCCISLNKSGN